MHRERSYNIKESGSTKNWYGWAEKRKNTRHGQKWKDISDTIWYALHWRSRTENYEWWFWDSDGSNARAQANRRDRSVLRYLPVWMRPSRPACPEHGFQTWHMHTCYVEQGQSNPISYYNFGPHASRVSMDGRMDFRDSSARRDETEHLSGSRRTPAAVMSGALSDRKNSSTVRRRHLSDGKLPMWHPGSEELYRAIHEQLLEDGKNYQQGQPMLNDDHMSQRYKRDPQARFETRPSAVDRRAQSMPVLADVMHPQTNVSKHHFRVLRSAEQLSRAKEYQDLRSGDLELLANCKVTAPIVSSIPAHDAGDMPTRNSASNPDASRLQCSQDTRKSLGSKVKWWTSLQGNGSSKSLGSNDHNATRPSRDFSFVTAQQRHSFDLHFDHLSAYEAEGSLDQAISDHESSTSTRAEMVRLSQYRKRWYQRSSLISSTKQTSGIYQEKAAGTGAYYSTNSLTRTARTSAAPRSFRTPRKRREPIDRALYVSMVVEPTDDEGSHRSGFSKPATLQRACAARSALFPPPHGGPFDSWRSGFKSKKSMYSRLDEEEGSTPQTHYPAEHGLSSRECQILPSRQSGESEPALDELFAQSLHGKLERLQYELSPGLRGPPSAFGASCGQWAPVFNSDLQTQVRSAGDTKRLKENVRRSATSPLRSPHSATAKSWKPLTEQRCIYNTDSTTTATFSKSTTALGNQQPLLQQEEPGFDPAAWILRRPPRGTESEFGAPNVLYAGKFGIRRTLAEWNLSPAAKSQSRKRGSSEAELENPPAKAIQRVSGLVKVRLRRRGNGQLPLGVLDP